MHLRSHSTPTVRALRNTSARKGGKSMKNYVSPVLDVLTLSFEDILTLSSGFDGDEHEFDLPM